MATLSDRMKLLRKSKKVTQEQLAAIIGVERSSVGKYESSSVIPSVDVLIKMADFFAVPIDYLLGRIDTPYHVTSTTSAVTGEPLKGYTASGDPAPLVSMRFSIRWPFVIIDGPYHR